MVRAHHKKDQVVIEMLPILNNEIDLENSQILEVPKQSKEKIQNIIDSKFTKIDQNIENLLNFQENFVPILKNWKPKKA